jgi:2-(1,2-epoxy-1,2-dihydrophenyl)acetyl-CoA isomerase
MVAWSNSRVELPVSGDQPMTDGLRVEVDGPVATITLDRPEALNALTVPVKVALREALESIAVDRSVRAVILTGAGRAFCAGQDLAEREQPDAAPLEIEVRERYNPIIRALRSMGQPVIAAVNGVAAGAGASLAFACDLRIAAEEARFVLAFGRIGLVPDSGATWFLPRIVGPAKAAELALVGDAVDAAEALRLGLVSRVVPGDRLMAETRAIADRLAEGAPLALSLTKEALQRSLTIGLDQALEGEAKLQGIAGASADHAEGLAAFREKRSPRFTGS